MFGAQSRRLPIRSDAINRRPRPRPSVSVPEGLGRKRRGGTWPFHIVRSMTVPILDSLSGVAYDLGMPTPSIADTYFSIPELMRVARGSYKRAVDIQLAAGGFEDLPTTSGYLLAYLANDEESIPERIEGLGIKQREFRQLVDTLVLRGYITREIDPADGKVSLALTERGRRGQ